MTDVRPVAAHLPGGSRHAEERGLSDREAPAARRAPRQDRAAEPGRLGCYVPRVLAQRLLERPESAVLSEDGTMVFIDISGFTKLSERLARTGREGAEHLTDTISACFSTLLAQAYAEGGSLLEVRRRRAAPVVHGRGARTPSGRLGGVDA